jgi:hypothetical protein
MLNSWMHGRKWRCRICDALLTQVYDKDWQWRSLGEPSCGGWKPAEAKDIEPGAVVAGGRWMDTADRVRHGDGVGAIGPHSLAPMQERMASPQTKTYDDTSKSLNSGILLMTSPTNPHSGSTFRLRRRAS